jgi:excisionase family DNA binding protein
MKVNSEHETGVDTAQLAGLIEKREVGEMERPVTPREAANLLRVHPKTIKRMAGRGKVPGHFRFGRWYFYASELDCWMRGEIHSSHRPCR